ncbi:oxidoreductase [Lutimonas sp.]|uniref:sialidase family protein n=1 Tax=Lutimonas sp. TaxID=1872403 RepID=UPI003D9B3BF6
MKKSILFTALFLCILSPLKAQKTTTLNVTATFDLPGISIRAIESIDESTLWFAGSNGRYGKIINEQIQIDSISHQGVYPQFRSIAYNGEFIFLLSIENPALLYRIDPNEPLGSFELVYEESHEKVFYDSLKFYDKKHGIAMGDPTDNCLSVLLTKDAGKTWQKVPCDKLPPVIEGEAAFAASNSNISTIGDTAWIVTGGKAARVFKSDQYGASWDVFKTPVIQGGKMTGIFTSAFYNGQKGIIMGGNWEDKHNSEATKAVTKDGGRTWSLIAKNELPGYISSVQYIPETKGKQIMAVSTEGIYLSKDAGSSWTKVKNDGFYSLEFVDEKTAWLSTHEQIIKIKID